MLKRCLCLILLLSISLPVLSKNVAISQKKSQLKVLTKKIAGLEQALGNARDKRQTLYNEIKKTDLNIGDLSKNLAGLSEQLIKQSKSLRSLKRQKNRQQLHLDHQYKLLMQHIASAYQLGDNQYLKLLLNQQSPNDLNRQLTYYHYFSQARYQIIRDTKSSLQALLESERQIRFHAKKLKSLVSQKSVQQQKLANVKKYQQHVVNQLSHMINSKTQRLSELTRSKRALETVISQLQRQRHTSWAKLDFHKMRHRLPWPTRGRIQAQSNGVFITANKRQAVRAIYSGKVVFANWLRSFGLLLILDHGNGYMSLYAHNESLYKSVGNTVLAGDLLAKVGSSGANNKNGLYFEIRHNGKPLKPSAWCYKLPS